MKVMVSIKSIYKLADGNFKFKYCPNIELTDVQKCKLDGAFRKKMNRLLFSSWFWQKKVDVCDLIGADIEVEI